jgi:putative endonuclease
MQLEKIDLAAGYLRSHGIEILDRDWNSGDGTLGLVASERNALVVPIIIGRLSARSGYLPNIVTGRARALAVQWMSAHGIRFDQVRIDVLTVTEDGPRRAHH